MIDRLVHALIASPNEAADDVLLEALDLGSDVERRIALGAILRRGRVRGLAGVVERYERLPGNLKSAVLDNVAAFGPALSECGRSLDVSRRLAAMKLIAVGRRSRLGYVLLENLGDGEERLQRGAVEAIVALARWAASETRKVQQGQGTRGHEHARQLLTQRDEIEDLVFRALERQRGAYGGELTRAALLLADWAGSKTLAMLRTGRNPARPTMERRLSQPPASENVDAWLLAASRAGVGPIRTAFAGTFAHVHERPVLDGLLRRGYWLKDLKVAGVVQNVMGGRWMDEVSLGRDLRKRDASDVGAIAEWVSASGSAEVVKDVLLGRLLEKSADDAGQRLRVVRVILARPRGASVQLLKELLADPDERIRRIAAREIARRRPVGYQNMLMGAMAGAPASVRQVIGRAVGDGGFRAYWRRWDRLDEPTRRSAGRAVVRIVPDVTKRLAAMLTHGDGPERVRVLQLARETDMVEGLRTVVMRLFEDRDARVRSKAVSVAGSLDPLPEEELVRRITVDDNPRVRANAVEVLEQVRDDRMLPVLAGRARSDANRERANAIKAVCLRDPMRGRVELLNMLSDARASHRVSALWVVRQVRAWDLLPWVGGIARNDHELAVRRYALGLLKWAAGEIQAGGRRKAAVA